MKILVWNIQFLTLKRILGVSGNMDDCERAAANLSYIVSTVEYTDPDLFIIVEPRCSQGAMGKMVDGGGPDALLWLLENLRAQMDLAEWCLVPPQRTNRQDHLASHTYTECVGVFWANDRLEFKGPWVWTADGAKPRGKPVPYGDPWNETVPKNTIWAGQAEFRDDNGLLRSFPDDYNRAPFLTRFVERTAPGRTVDVYAVHTSPSSAQGACASILNIDELVPGDNQMTVITGDFNINLFNMSTLEDATVDQGKLYEPPITLIKPIGIDGKVKPTRVRKREEATWGAYLGKEALDYAFVGYGKNASLGHRPLVLVVDRVAGSRHFPTDMETGLADYDTLALNTDGKLARFRQRQNYGHIAQPQRNAPDEDSPSDGTSDHLPILFVG